MCGRKLTPASVGLHGALGILHSASDLTHVPPQSVTPLSEGLQLRLRLGESLFLRRERFLESRVCAADTICLNHNCFLHLSLHEIRLIPHIRNHEMMMPFMAICYPI